MILGNQLTEDLKTLKVYMKSVFKSKIGLEFLAPLVLTMIIMLVLLVTSRTFNWHFLIIPGLIFTVFMHMFLTTYYTIEGDVLQVRCGLMMNMKISIATITAITETRDSTSAPAISLDRLRIDYGKGKSILISPKEKRAFIHGILSLNNTIEVNYKKRKMR